MIEIIVLVFLTIEIGKLAREKGLKPLTWKFYNVVGLYRCRIFWSDYSVL